MLERQPLYLKVKNDIKKKILNDEFVKDRPLHTEKKMSEIYKVSRITIQRALTELENEGLIIRKQGSGTYISDLSQSPNGSSNGSKLISLVLPFEVSAAGMFRCVEAISDVFSKEGYLLTIKNSCSNVKIEGEILEQLLDEDIAGVILYPLSEQNNMEIIHRYKMRGKPIVTIDKHFECLGISSVVSDNFTGGYLVADHLIKGTDGKVAFISDVPIENASSIRNRYLGYCKALNDNNKKYDPNVVRFDVEGEYHRNSANYSSYINYIECLIAELMENGVTAIQIVNDIIAILAVQVCERLKIDIPDKLSIAGFDAIHIGQHIKCPITTVRQNFYSIGKTAAEMILELIEGKNKDCRQIVIPTNLVVRKSSKIVPQKLSVSG